MQEQFSRTEILFGEQAMQTLAGARVAVFGIGGVGCFAVEALVRSGIGALDLIDNDTFSVSNLNRQLYATHKTVGQYKVDVAAQRIAEINPDCKVTVHKCFFLPENASEFDFAQYDYIVDAIDTVKGKLGLVVAADRAGVPIISSMGAGNKVDATAFEVADIYKTSVCPLAKVMRTELKKLGIRHLKVVYSKEVPMRPLKEICAQNETAGRKDIPGSTSFVPSAVGLMIAGEVIKDLTGIRGQVL